MTVLQIIHTDTDGTITVHTDIPVPETDLGRDLKRRKLDIIAQELGAGYSVRTDIPVEPTDEELEVQQTALRIAELKSLLQSSDFKMLHDYQVRSGKTDAEIQVIINQRAEWYNELISLEEI